MSNIADVGRPGSLTQHTCNTLPSLLEACARSAQSAQESPRSPKAIRWGQEGRVRVLHLQATHSLLLLPEVTRPEAQLLTFRTAKTATPATVPTRGKLNSHLWPAFSWWYCALTSLLNLPPSHAAIRASLQVNKEARKAVTG